MLENIRQNPIARYCIQQVYELFSSELQDAQTASYDSALIHLTIGDGKQRLHFLIGACKVWNLYNLLWVSMAIPDICEGHHLE